MEYDKVDIPVMLKKLDELYKRETEIQNEVENLYKEYTQLKQQIELLELMIMYKSNQNDKRKTNIN